MIIEKQTIKNKSELQTKIQKIQCSKITVYENVDKKTAEKVLKELSPKKFTAIILEA